MKTKQEIVNDWLPRYTGKSLESFGEYVLLTNFHNYIEMFATKFGVEVEGSWKADGFCYCTRDYHH
jgi:AMP nucleosidase